MLVTPRLADMVGENRPANIPGTRDKYANWRLKLRVPLEQLVDKALFTRT
jgi:4-alpha-glucanotransferase